MEPWLARRDRGIVVDARWPRDPRVAVQRSGRDPVVSGSVAIGVRGSRVRAADSIIEPTPALVYRRNRAG